jgi:hypothetical protein
MNKIKHKLKSAIVKGIERTYQLEKKKYLDLTNILSTDVN